MGEIPLYRGTSCTCAHTILGARTATAHTFHNINCQLLLLILDFFRRVSWVGVGEKFKMAPLGNPFLKKKVALRVGPKCSSSILRRGKRYEANKYLNTHIIRSVCVFLILKTPENPFGPKFSSIKKTEGAPFLKVLFLYTRYPCTLVTHE